MMAKLIPITDAGALCLIALVREFLSQKKQAGKKPTTSKYYLKAKHLKDVKNKSPPGLFWSDIAPLRLVQPLLGELWSSLR